MPIYENRHNAENLVKIAPSSLAQIRHGFDAALDMIVETVNAKKSCCLILDGWYGIDWGKNVPALQRSFAMLRRSPVRRFSMMRKSWRN